MASIWVCYSPLSCSTKGPSRGIVRSMFLLCPAALKALVSAFFAVPAVLDDLGVQYFADFGTLLGMYREVSQTAGLLQCYVVNIAVVGCKVFPIKKTKTGWHSVETMSKCQ